MADRRKPCSECTVAIETGFDRQLVVVHPGCLWAYVSQWVAGEDQKKAMVRKWNERRRDLYQAVLRARVKGDEEKLAEAESDLSVHDGMKWA